MSGYSTLSALYHEMAKVFSPLAHIADSPEAFRRFMWALGWYAEDMPTSFTDLKAYASTLVDILDDIADGERPAPDQYAELVSAVSGVIKGIKKIAETPSSEFPAELIANHFLEEFPRQLIDHLLADYLFTYNPTVFGVFTTCGLIEVTEIEQTETRPNYLDYRIIWEHITTLITDPNQVFIRTYGWGEDNFNPFLIYQHVLFLLNTLGVRAYLANFDIRLAPALEGDTEIPPDAYRMSVRAPIFEDSNSEVEGEMGLGLYGLPMARRDHGEILLLPGLAITPYAIGDLEKRIEINENLSLIVESQFDISAGLGIVLRPDEPLQCFADIFPSTDTGEAPASGGQLTIKLEYSNEDAQPTTIIGLANSSRLEVKSVSVRGGVRLLSTEELDILVELILQGGKIVIQGSEGDGFISHLLPEDGISVNFDLVVGISRDQGIYFGGSGGLEVSLPTHFSLGPIDFESLTLSVRITEEGIPVSAGATINANLGPLSATVENMGLEVVLAFDDDAGNLGPVDLHLGFKPPNGVGLAIDAGVVSGGGYLYFDFDKEEYAGILELDLNGIVSVKAIGLITTKMPDGSKGFSLLLIITAEFGSPIQLGYGFTLSGVGGLLGLNRTMRLEVIATGIRDGGINSVMFPHDVVANAPRILSDLKKYFPVQEGTFLIGPMVKIGWGTPNLVTVSLGIIIEIPGNIAILGVLKIALPDEDFALIVIQVTIMGSIEFDKKRLCFFATLFESRVLFITLEGDMGLLLGWGDNAAFVASVGGFHPAFNPPPLPLGAIARIAFSILNTSFARIRVDAYFAVTSNTVQFGARAELYFGLSAFNIDGHLGFDALFRFSPFYFIITISTSLSVKVFGIGLFSVRFRGSLEGPTPWHVEGTGSISLLFFDTDVDFSHTWGNEEETTLPPISVMPLLVAECQKPENWQAVLPANNRLLVSLRSFEQGSVDLVLHPVGSLKISQRAVPLGVTIDKVGNQKPSDANKFNIAVNTPDMAEFGTIEEQFAAGQYFAKSDSELLSAKSFQPIKGGMELAIAGEQHHAPQAVRRLVRYEKKIIDTQFRRFVQPFFGWFGSLFSLFLKGNAVSKSELSAKQQKLHKPFTDKVEVGQMLYGVAFNHDNTAYSALAMNFASQVQAEEFMREQVRTDARLAKQLHVIPQVEMEEVS